MLGLSSHVRYHMCCTLIDMRKGFDGLAGLVRNYLNQNPQTGDVFVFLNKSKTHIKLLYWDDDGFAIFYKRLEQGRFDFLTCDSVSRELKREELLCILSGLTLRDFKKKKRYKTEKKSA
jgi:transposase